MLVTELSDAQDLWAHILEQNAFIRAIQDRADVRVQRAHDDLMKADAELAQVKAELARVKAELAQAQAQLDAQTERIANLRAGYFNALDDIELWRDERDALVAERNALRDELTAQQDANELTDAKMGIVGLLADSWDDVAVSRGLGFARERRYAYWKACDHYKPSIGRGRIGRSNFWMGGVQRWELMRLAKDESVYLNHRELARLQAYAAQWDATAEQMLNDSIPW